MGGSLRRASPTRIGRSWWPASCWPASTAGAVLAGYHRSLIFVGLFLLGLGLEHRVDRRQRARDELGHDRRTCRGAGHGGPDDELLRRIPRRSAPGSSSGPGAFTCWPTAPASPRWHWRCMRRRWCSAAAQALTQFVEALLLGLAQRVHPRGADLVEQVVELALVVRRPVWCRPRTGDDGGRPRSLRRRAGGVAWRSSGSTCRPRACPTARPARAPTTQGDEEEQQPPVGAIAGELQDLGGDVDSAQHPRRDAEEERGRSGTRPRRSAGSPAAPCATPACGRSQRHADEPGDDDDHHQVPAMRVRPTCSSSFEPKYHNTAMETRTHRIAWSRPLASGQVATRHTSPDGDLGGDQCQPGQDRLVDRFDRVDQHRERRTAPPGTLPSRRRPCRRGTTGRWAHVDGVWSRQSGRPRGKPYRGRTVREA